MASASGATGRGKGAPMHPAALHLGKTSPAGLGVTPALRGYASNSGALSVEHSNGSLSNTCEGMKP